MDLHIPPDYISDETQRLQTYKRLAEVETEEQRERMRAELRDRYGTLPEAVETLMGYSLIKYLAEKMRVESIERRRNQWRLRFREDSKVNTGELMRLVATTAGANFSPRGELAWPLAPGEDVIPAAALDHLKGLLKQLAPPPAADPENAPKQ
jgi:transcription-repair coupling factor (superfamily II helicase)